MLDRLNRVYLRKVAEVSLDFTRYIYPRINWNNQLIMIKGPKGVGKTTMILQHIRRTFPDLSKALYASVDSSYFSTKSIVDLAEYAYTHGLTHLFLDEVHKYKGWDQQIKEVYDALLNEYEEGMDSVMLGHIFAGVVDTTTCNDCYITVLTDEEIIVDILFVTCLRDDYRDMYTLIYCIIFDNDINTWCSRIFLGHDINICCSIS